MSAANSLAKTGSLWHQRIQNLREYEVVRDGNTFSTGFNSSFVFSSEYHEARQLLGNLLSRYEGLSFESVFRGTEEVNDGGTCFAQKSCHNLTPARIDTDRFHQELLRDLTLVRGIGPAMERRLRGRGYETVVHLLEHPRYRSGAKKVISSLSEGNTGEIMEMIAGRHSRSDLSILGTTALHDPEDFVFFDIETLGLFSRPIILLGLGSLENNTLHVCQYLLRNMNEEEAALVATRAYLSGDHPALVTFNGKSFDLPYLADRLAYYGMGSPAAIPHFDMLHFSRRRWKSSFSSLRLPALEREVLGFRRDNDVPGQMVPEFYAEYLKSGNCGPLVPILEHNRQDIVSLAQIFFHLIGESNGCS